MVDVINICINPSGVGGVETFSRILSDLFPCVKNYSFGVSKSPVFKADCTLFERNYSNVIARTSRLLFNWPKKYHIPDFEGNVIIFNAPCDFDHFTEKFFKKNNVIYVAHNCPEHVLNHANYFGVKRKSRLRKLKFVKRVVCLSNSYVREFSDLLDYPEKYIRVISHTVELEVVGKIKERPFTVGTICRIENKAKRLDRFLEVALLLPDFDFVIYGGGPDADWLLNHQKKYPNVYYKGETSNVAESLSTIGVFLMTSDFEGFGISLIEALSQGVPIVIAKNSFARARDIVIDGFNGYVCEDYSNSTTAQKILDVFSEIDEYSRSALQSFHRYNKNNFRQQWHHIFSEFN